MGKGDHKPVKKYCKKSYTKSKMWNQCAEDPTLNQLDAQVKELVSKEDEWSQDIIKRYSDDDVSTIVSLLFYYDNEYRGFGRSNNQILYQELIRDDKDGRLNREAKVGFELTKKWLDARSEANAYRKNKITA